VSGTLVESGRPAELAEAIRRLLNDAHLRCRYSRNGLERVRAEFSFEARMRAEERFYQGVIQ
jgi:spore maturation protein CgeB